MNWEFIEEGLDGQSLAMFRNEHGDEVEVRDTYENPVALMTAREDRYKVVYDAGFDDPGVWRTAYERWSRSFGRPEDAFEYAGDVMNIDLEKFQEELEGYL